MKLVAALVVAAGCGAAADSTVSPVARTRGDLPPMLVDVTLPPPVPGQPDGEGDGQAEARLDRLGAGVLSPVEGLPDTALPIVCDLVPFGGALYVSHARDVINRSGARIHRWSPDRGWSLALDYDRGGQGFPRVRVLGGQLAAVDGDSTSAGFFGVTQASVETYLFVSDAGGQFDPIGDLGGDPPARMRAMPQALHLFDAIEYAGAVVVSGGAGIRDDRTGSWPAGLWIGTPTAAELPLRHVVGGGNGVVRTTYMHRFGGRLYIGFQNNEHRARFDVAVLGGMPMDPGTPEPVLARVTEDGGWLTRRFASGDGVLYWVASGYRRGRPGTLFSSTDGVSFARVDLSAGAGAVQDVVAVGDRVFVLTTTALYGRERGGSFDKLADAPPGDPFGFFDQFCSAPLAAFDGTLYAGSTRDGRVFRFVPR